MTTPPTPPTKAKEDPIDRKARLVIGCQLRTDRILAMIDLMLELRDELNRAGNVAMRDRVYDVARKLAQ